MTTGWDRNLVRVAQDFDELAPLYDNFPSARSFDDLLISFLPVARSKVLEVGCGTGALLAKIANRNHTVIGCDISNNMVVRARQNLSAFDARVERWAVESLAHRSFSDKFDLIIAERVIHHCGCPLDVANVLFEMLAPGGTLLILDLRFTGRGSIRQRLGSLIEKGVQLLSAGSPRELASSVYALRREREIMKHPAWIRHLNNEPVFEIEDLAGALSNKQAVDYLNLSTRFGLLIVRMPHSREAGVDLSLVA